MPIYSLRLTPEQHDQLRHLSLATSHTKAEHIRIAIEQYLASENDPAPPAQQTVKPPRRHNEIAEFTYLALDRFFTDKYGEGEREKLLDQLDVNMRDHHA